MAGAYGHIPHVPKRGDILLGQVISVGDKIATASISLMLRLDENIKMLQLPRVTHAYIFRGDVGVPCVSIGDVLKIGDIVLGSVKIDWFRPVFLSLNGESLGIVCAVCPNCGIIMPKPRDLSMLICPRCKTARRTKISILYNPAIWYELHKRHKIRIYSPLQ